MIKEQSCPSCTIASTTCDQSWGPPAPGTVHHAAKQLWCLSRPWKSEAINPPESTGCEPLKSMTKYAPWVPQAGVHPAIPEVEKKRRPDTQTTLSLPFSRVFDTTAPVWKPDTAIFLQMHDQTFWCVCDCRQPDIGMYRRWKIQAATS